MKVDLEELERLDKEELPIGPWKDGRGPDGRWIFESAACEITDAVGALRASLPAIIAELRAGRALRAGLVGRLWASDVQALKTAYDKATKGDG